jgi:alpha-acetolactate decarboxylase
MNKSYAVLVTLCSCAGSSRPTAPAAPQPDVTTWGSMRALMHEGRTEGRVAIAPLLAAPHVYAVGALAGMRGEVTILDGKPWLAYGDRDAGQPTTDPGIEAATLLVASQVGDWTRVTLTEDIAFADLDRRIERLAAQAGVDVEKPFAFLVEGQLSEVHWHVLKGPPAPGTGRHTENAVVGEADRIDGTLVAFFSKHHQGVFTHMGENVHAHLVTASLAAHADQVSIRASSVLAFPRR